MSGRESQVPALDSALRVLGLIARQRGPVPAAMIARSLDLPRSTTYSLLRVLEQHGYVSHMREERKWGMGLMAFDLSSAYSRQEPLARLGTPLLAALVDEVGESAHLAVLHGRDVIYIVEMRAKHRPALVTDVGVRLASDVTASGQAMLYALPAHQLRAMFSRAEAFSDVDRSGRTPYLHLRGVLAEARERGYASEDEAVSPGLASVAVPVLDHMGWPAASIAVTFERNRFPKEEWASVASSVRAYARELSRRIGGHDATAEEHRR